MSFICAYCEEAKDDLARLVIPERGEIRRYCRSCMKPKAGIPDVYFDGKPEENLADDPRTGKPRVFSSKAEKAAYLKERGLIEAGDRVHGAPVSLIKKEESRNSRDMVREALHRVKQMGRDVRRQAYLKIMKEAQRHA